MKTENPINLLKYHKLCAFNADEKLQGICSLVNILSLLTLEEFPPGENVRI